MTLRTTKRTVIFENSFTLGDFDEVLPPSAYVVEDDEEFLPGLSFRAYQRTQTLIQLLAKVGLPGVTKKLVINPEELATALERETASVRTSPVLTSSSEGPAKRTPKSREAEADLRALDRAEDEGMIVDSH